MDPALSASPKSALQSKTIIGIIVALLPTLLNLFGVELTDAETQATAGDVVAILGGGFAIYGRFSARQPVKIGAAAKVASLLLWVLFGAFASYYLTGCAQVSTGFRERVESVEGYAKADYDPTTKAYGGRGGVKINFRDPRADKSIKPLSLDERALGETPLIVTRPPLAE